MGVVTVVAFFLRAFLVPRAAIAAGNLALHRQRAILRVSMKRLRLRKRDRIFWGWLSRIWFGWCSCRMIVKSDTFRGAALFNRHPPVLGGRKGG
jgi:hypothetical protein